MGRAKQRDIGAVTRGNRPLAGYTGVKDEYLVLAPEMFVDGEREDIDWISDAAFSGCDQLKTVVVLNGFRTIGEAAFYGCTGMTSITLPVGIKCIRARTFMQCDIRIFFMP